MIITKKQEKALIRLSQERDALKAENERLKAELYLAEHWLIIERDDSEELVSLIMNDVFTAGADGEEVPRDKLFEVVNIHKRFGEDGLIAWASMQNGCSPQMPKTKEYKQAMKALKEADHD